MPKRGVLYLSHADVKRLVRIPAVVDLAEHALRVQARGQVVWSTPRLLSVGAPDLPARLAVKGCALQDIGIMGARVVTANRSQRAFIGEEVGMNPCKLDLLADPQTGEFLAVVVEDWSHAVRTGAGAAVAVKYLARSGPLQVAMIGAGLVAAPTVLAIASVRELAEVRVTSRTAESRDALARELTQELPVPVRPVATAEEACRDADVIVTATTAATPLVKEEWLKPGAFIYSMGDNQEVETDAYRKVDKFMADDWEQCKTRVDIAELTRQGVIREERVHGSLWQVVDGAIPGRESETERIMMRSQGLVTQDIALSYWLYQEALKLGIGRWLEHPSEA